MKGAVGVLRAHGGPDDLLQYSDFVRSLAMRVARAAKEGDVLGVGGELVSVGERASSSGSRRSRGNHSRCLRQVAERRPPRAHPGATPGRPARCHSASFSTSPLISFFFKLPTK